MAQPSGAAIARLSRRHHQPPRVRGTGDRPRRPSDDAAGMKLTARSGPDIFISLILHLSFCDIPPPVMKNKMMSILQITVRTNHTPNCSFTRAKIFARRAIIKNLLNYIFAHIRTKYLWYSNRTIRVLIVLNKSNHRSTRKRRVIE